MPRLTNVDYLAHHQYLREIWVTHRSSFGTLSWAQQMSLHQYYRPTKKMTDEQLLNHRVATTKAHPSLPNRAGKSLALLRQSVDAYDSAPRTAYVPGAPVARKSDTKPVLLAIANPDYTPDLMAKLLLQIARDQMMKK